MKKVLLILFVALGMFGCQSKGKKIDDFDNLNQSMKLFHSIQSEYSSEGDYFAVKVVRVDRTDTDNALIYRYTVAIAPLRDQKIDIRSIKFQNNDAVEKVFFQQWTVHAHH